MGRVSVPSRRPAGLAPFGSKPTHRSTPRLRGRRRLGATCRSRCGSTPLATATPGRGSSISATAARTGATTSCSPPTARRRTTWAAATDTSWRWAQWPQTSGPTWSSLLTRAASRWATKMECRSQPQPPWRFLRSRGAHCCWENLTGRSIPFMRGTSPRFRSSPRRCRPVK